MYFKEVHGGEGAPIQCVGRNVSFFFPLSSLAIILHAPRLAWELPRNGGKGLV